MENRKEDVRLSALGQSVLKRLAEAENEMHRLEVICRAEADAIRHCEEMIDSVAVDIASVATGGGEWDEMAEMMRSCGFTVLEDLDGDMRRLIAGDDSVLL
ncbi:MAG: hypothetical protein IJU74_01475 [Bacteroidales bacterium]|nr:hypothetical protein [Bacteroidales bacterium]